MGERMMIPARDRQRTNWSRKKQDLKSRPRARNAAGLARETTEQVVRSRAPARRVPGSARDPPGSSPAAADGSSDAQRPRPRPAGTST